MEQLDRYGVISEHTLSSVMRSNCTLMVQIDGNFAYRAWRMKRSFGALLWFVEVCSSVLHQFVRVNKL